MFVWLPLERTGDKTRGYDPTHTDRWQAATGCHKLQETNRLRSSEQTLVCANCNTHRTNPGNEIILMELVLFFIYMWVLVLAPRSLVHDNSNRFLTISSGWKLVLILIIGLRYIYSQILIVNRLILANNKTAINDCYYLQLNSILHLPDKDLGT